MNNRNKSIALLLVFTLMLSLFQTMTNNTIDAAVVADSISAYRNLSINEMFMDTKNMDNNAIDMTYDLAISPVSVNSVGLVPSDKEVVLVLDTSASMLLPLADDEEGRTRLQGIKDVVVNFLDEVKDNPSVYVSIVDFNEKAEVYKDADPLVSVYDEYDSLKTYVENLSTESGSNMGDGLRRAKYILDNENENAEKYVIFITDGIADALSFTDADIVEESDNDKSIGQVFTDFGSVSTIVKDIKSVKELTEDGDPEKYFVNKEGTGNYLNHASNYAMNRAKELKGYHNDFINFTQDAPNNGIKEMCSQAKADEYEALTISGLQTIFDKLDDEIEADLVIGDVNFTEVMPEGISIVSLPDDFKLKESRVTGSFDITYKLNNNGTYYVADDISFKITLAPEEPGVYVFGENNTSSINYDDLDGDKSSIYFPTTSLTANEPDGTQMEDDVLDILEIQPDRNFELKKSVLEEKLPGYTVNLTQLTLDQYNGYVEPINGKYDIVYFGETESFTNNAIKGIKSGKDYTIHADIDITNRRAADVIDYAKTGQLVVYDQDIMDYSGSKLESNFSKIIALDNVVSVKKMDNKNLDLLDDWYNGATHRPRLTVLSRPLEYDLPDLAYESDHIMKYLYSVYNVDSNAMTASLFIDIDGDGIYEDFEEVVQNNIAKNAANQAINYDLNAAFNGLMPWKVELTDTVTGAKDYQIGYTAYKGDKTIVRVLQLTPGDNRLNMNSSAFTKPLITEDYELHITFMEVSKFDEAYAAWESDPNPDPYPADVNGHPTVINGNYDMILFGFGDSYGGKDSDESKVVNKDLKSQAAIDAIDDFIATGQSIMFTHDTAGPQDWVNNFDMRNSKQSYNEYVTYNDAPNITANFKDDMGFSNTRTYAGRKIWTAWKSHSAYKLNEGLITKYPYILAPNADRVLDIATTHDQYWEIDMEQADVVPWFTLNAGDYKYYPTAYYYTFSNGNVTYSGTGHSTPDGEEEQEFFVNTMLKAARSANHAPSMDIEDLYDGMNVSPDDRYINFNFTVHDPDFQDQKFNTKIYIVIDGSEYLAEELVDLPKDVRKDVALRKPAALDDTVDTFLIKLVTEDPQGAKAEESFNSTHRNVPKLTIDSNDIKVLIGDAFTVNYTVSTEDAAEEANIKNIDLKTTINSAAYEVNSSPNWTESGSTYSVNPMFDDPTTANDESFTDFSLNMKAKGVTSSSLSLAGDYDMIYNDGRTDMYNQQIRNYTNIAIRNGTIKVAVYEDGGLNRKIEGASVEIYDTANVRKGNGTIPSTGQISVDQLKSGTYRVVVDLNNSHYTLPSNEKTVTLSYSNHDILVEFKAVDNTPPTIEKTYDPTFIINGAGLTNLPVHVKVDGVNSTIVETYYKKLPTGTTTASVANFQGTNALDNLSLSVYNPSNSDLDLRQSPYDPLSTYAQGYYFNVTGNGYYAIYTKNASGLTKVSVVHISNYLDADPDMI